ncbi:GntR family transcriptional regulator [Brevibacterium jeotgali]|uniref:DNA-binding transcriptional regulator, GntR family n=1 Tax=Brevibacterium jeotgali TaxID=1262550 RepID=A0A2H1L877_9MICO|nr:GntR family transcriptional regulator [Brevibacterium jeotgali]TWC01615.1 GntR family transcriptional regulator [Brevibacterium jeotgali]SMY13072.1 DNA-binding transcriptional regulator, GntR family [Brevibacterium jeotgali]
MPIPTGPGLTPRTLLRDDVYRRIRDTIVRGELQPGEKLRDGELGAWLGVSRTPVREALLKLAEAGLVTAKPGRETIVAPEDPVALAHARTIAAELHGLAARLAAPHAAGDESAIARLRAANARLDSAADPEAAITADTDFHDVVVGLSGNPLLPGQLDTLVPVLLRAEFLHFDAETVAASARQHEAIIETLLACDGHRAASLTRENWLSLG